MATVSSGSTFNVSSGTTSYNDVIQSGGVEYVGRFNNFGGGIAVSATDNGGKIYFEGSGAGSSVLIQSGGTAFVDNGGTLSGGTVKGGGVISAFYQGNTANATSGSASVVATTVSSGGTLQVMSGASGSGAVVLSGGTEYVGKFNSYGGGTTTGDRIEGGTLYVEASGHVNGAIIESGGTAYVDNIGVISGATVQSGGVLSAFWQGNNGRDYAGSALATTVGNGGLLTVGSGSVASNTHVLSGGTARLTAAGAIVSGTTLDVGGSIDFSYLGGTITSASISSSGLLTVSASTGSSATLQLTGSYTSSESLNTSQDTVTLVCFLAGSLINTPAGEKVVEELAIGDDVVTYDNGHTSTAPITWVGKARHVVNRAMPDDEAGYPVCFKAHSMGENNPHSDLLVTSEHCMFLDGAFVPARMLVNGRTIYYDTRVTSYEYYHIETADHSVIRACGTLTESYLDTGNRRNFTQPGTVVSLSGAQRSWETDAAAPLVTDRHFVETQYNKFNEIADQLGYGSADNTSFDTDADLHLTVGGQVIRPVRQNGKFAVFQVPARSADIQICSRTSRPSRTVGPFVDDRRDLGVLIGQIAFYAEDGTHQVQHHLENTELTGWSVTENSPCRWTLGNAALPLDFKTAGVLAVEVLQAGPYEKATNSTVFMRA